MSSLEEELINTLPKNGPSLDEIKKYLDKYDDEFIVIKCGGSVLIDPNLFNIFIYINLYNYNIYFFQSTYQDCFPL